MNVSALIYFCGLISLEMELQSSNLWPSTNINNLNSYIMKTLAEKKQEILDFIEAQPEKEFSTGLFFESMGHKYVHYYSIWDKTTSKKMDISEFYENFILR